MPINRIQRKPQNRIRAGTMSDFFNDVVSAVKSGVDTVRQTAEDIIPGAGEYVDTAVNSATTYAKDAAGNIVRTVLPGQTAPQTTTTTTQTAAPAATNVPVTQTTTTTRPVQTAVPSSPRPGGNAAPASAPMVQRKLWPVVTGLFVGIGAGLLGKSVKTGLGCGLLATVAHHAYAVDRQLPA